MWWHEENTNIHTANAEKFHPPTLLSLSLSYARTHALRLAIKMPNNTTIATDVPIYSYTRKQWPCSMPTKKNQSQKEIYFPRFSIRIFAFITHNNFSSSNRISFLSKTKISSMRKERVCDACIYACVYHIMPTLWIGIGKNTHTLTW